MDSYSKAFMDGFAEALSKESAGKLPYIMGGLGMLAGGGALATSAVAAKKSKRRGTMVDMALAEAYRRQGKNQMLDIANEKALAQAAIANRADIDRLKLILSKALASR